MNIEDIKKQEHPMNRGTQFGKNLLKRSLQMLGLTRSIVVDKNDIVLCGDKVLDTVRELGIRKVQVVETTGDTLIVVKRTDVDASSRKGLEIQLIDNFSQEKNLDFDNDTIIARSRENFSFTPQFWGAQQVLIPDVRIEDFLKRGVERAAQNEKKEQNQVQSSHIQMNLFDFEE